MNDLLFIHIPKTGGTSVSSSLSNRILQYRDHRYKNHDPLFLVEEKYNIKNLYKFAIVRDPYTRAVSLYKHFNRFNNLNYSFEQFLKVVNSKGSLLLTDTLQSANHQYVIQNTPMFMFTQNYFLTSFKDYTVDKIYKFENLQELEDDFNLKLPHHNKGNYPNSLLKTLYNDKTIKIVNQIYKEDFERFGYSLQH